MPFPNSAATVQEQRAEAMLTYGRPLAPNLTLQASLGGEYSQLSQEGAGGLTRTFYRPKGFLNLAWTPRPGFDLSARIERVVGQLNFFDFVASANVSGGTTNAGNANLVPPQSWNAQIQATRNLGRWGTVTARLYGRLISDIVDVIPIGIGGQSPGNLPGTATRLRHPMDEHVQPRSDRHSRRQARHQHPVQKTRLTDPLTGAAPPDQRESRRARSTSPSATTSRARNWAYGAEYFQFRQSPGFRLDQRCHFVDTPGSLGAYVEHKNVFGLTVRASVDNLLGTNESFGRSLLHRHPAEPDRCSPRIATASTARSSP